MALRSRLTADFTNDEDSIQRPGSIREDMGGLFFAAGAPPSIAALDYSKRVVASFKAAMAEVATFERGDIARANTALKASGKPPLATSGAKRADVVGAETPASEDRD
jgi:hypothetical protein